VQAICSLLLTFWGKEEQGKVVKDAVRLAQKWPPANFQEKCSRPKETKMRESFGRCDDDIYYALVAHLVVTTTNISTDGGLIVLN
jgi:hypothetical protein